MCDGVLSAHVGKTTEDFVFAVKYNLPRLLAKCKGHVLSDLPRNISCTLTQLITGISTSHSMVVASQQQAQAFGSF